LPETPAEAWPAEAWAAEAWERDDCVRRTIVLPAELAARLAARAHQRGLSVSDLLAQYAAEGLAREHG
jgi:hypothetical protein